MYKSRFMLSEKQKANLNQWHKLNSSEQANTNKDDKTTEEENLY
jgi:hypothetical protein